MIHLWHWLWLVVSWCRIVRLVKHLLTGALTLALWWNSIHHVPIDVCARICWGKWIFINIVWKFGSRSFLQSLWRIVYIYYSFQNVTSYNTKTVLYMNLVFSNDTTHRRRQRKETTTHTHTQAAFHKCNVMITSPLFCKKKKFAKDTWLVYTLFDERKLLFALLTHMLSLRKLLIENGTMCHDPQTKRGH